MECLWILSVALTWQHDYPQNQTKGESIDANPLRISGKCMASTSFSKAKSRTVKGKKQSMQNYLRGLTLTLWKACKDLKRPTQYSPRLRPGNGDWARSNAEKGAVLATHYRNVFTANPVKNKIQLRQRTSASDLKMVLSSSENWILKKHVAPTKLQKKWWKSSLSMLWSIWLRSSKW